MKKVKLVEKEGYKCVHLQDFIYINTSVKWWIAEITGTDPKFKFKREFIQELLKDSKRKKTTYLPVEELPFGGVIEIVGGSWKNQSRFYFIPRKYNREYLEYEELAEGEVKAFFDRDNTKDVKALALIRQAIELVGLDAVKMLVESEDIIEKMDKKES